MSSYPSRVRVLPELALSLCHVYQCCLHQGDGGWDRTIVAAVVGISEFRIGLSRTSACVRGEPRIEGLAHCGTIASIAILLWLDCEKSWSVLCAPDLWLIAMCLVYAPMAS